MTTEFEVTQVRKVHACCEVFIMVDVIIILLQDLNRHTYILDITMRQMIFKLIVFECFNSKFSVKSCLYFHSTDLPNSVV